MNTSQVNAKCLSTLVLRIIGIYWFVFGITFVWTACTFYPITIRGVEWVINVFLFEKALPALAVTLTGMALIIRAASLINNLRNASKTYGNLSKTIIKLTAWIWIGLGVFIVTDISGNFLHYGLGAYYHDTFDEVFASIILDYGFCIFLMISGITLVVLTEKFIIRNKKPDTTSGLRFEPLIIMKIAGYVWILAGLVLTAKFIDLELVHGVIHGWRFSDDIFRIIEGVLTTYIRPLFYIITGLTINILSR